MKRIARQFTYPTALAVAAVLLAFMVFASPSPSRAASPEPGMATAGRVSKVDRVEARIKELQTKLKITPAQEELWNKVTQVMRDDAKTMEALIKARSENAEHHDRYRRSQILWRNCRGTCRWPEEIHPGLRASLCQHVGRSEEGC